MIAFCFLITIICRPIDLDIGLVSTTRSDRWTLSSYWSLDNLILLFLIQWLLLTIFRHLSLRLLLSISGAVPSSRSLFLPHFFSYTLSCFKLLKFSHLCIFHSVSVQPNVQCHSLFFLRNLLCSFLTFIFIILFLPLVFHSKTLLAPLRSLYWLCLNHEIFFNLRRLTFISLIKCFVKRIILAKFRSALEGISRFLLLLCYSVS